MRLSQPANRTRNPGASSGTRALAYMAASATLFALMNFFARLASSTGSWASVGAVRALVGALVAFLVARSRGASLEMGDKRALLLRSLFGTASMLATFYALSSRTLSLGDTVTLLNLTPVFLAVVAPLVLRERTPPAVVIAIAVALAGVVLVVHPTFLFGVDPGVAKLGEGLPGPSAAASAASATCASLLAAVAMTMLRRVGQRDTAEGIAMYFSLFAFVVFAAVATLDPRMPSGRDMLFMVLAGVAAGFAQIAMTRAYALERAARVGSMSSLAVVASALLGAGLLRERPTASAVAGMGLVVASGLLVTLAREPASPPP